MESSPTRRTVKPHNVAAWALRPNQRPLVVGAAAFRWPPHGHVVIRVTDVAVNPIDWIIQSQDRFGLKYPAVLGLDVAGEIVAVGTAAEGVQLGTRVIAHCNPYAVNDPSHGAFQKYTVVPQAAVAELPLVIPTSLGVVLPLGISTASAGLFQKGYLGLPLPSEQPTSLGRTVVVWGGSSSVGSCAIQLATASGADVITTASPKNFAYCKNLGARLCFDYHDDTVENQIVEALKTKTVAGAYHAVGADGAVQTCARIVDRTKGKAIVVTVRGVPDEGIPNSVRAKAISSSDIFTNDVGPYIWRHFLPKALETGTIRPAPAPLRVGEELRSVQLALDKQKAGVSAAKVVVTNIS